MATPITAFLGSAFDLSEGAVLGLQQEELRGQQYLAQRLKRNQFNRQHPGAIRYTTPAKRGNPIHITPSPTKRQRTNPTAAPGNMNIPPHGYVARRPVPVRGDQSHGWGERVTDSARAEDNQHCGKMYIYRLPLPDVVPGNAIANTTDKGSFKIKGWKIHREFHGKNSENATLNPTTGQDRPSTQHMGPCVVNWALVQWNCAVSNANALAELKQRFWVNHASDGDYYRAFLELPPVAPTNTTVQTYDVDWLSGSINTRSTNYRVLCRKRFPIMQIKAAHSGDTWQRTRATVATYIKADQRVYLFENLKDNWDKPVFEVVWYTPINANVLLSWPTTANANQFNTISRHTTYYRELTH